ncbi:MAG TPA: FecR domain-containing protein [Pyrinomonadaceae bacterium]|jgi:hypothetical protein|nr:FecR domain-containing protein [Pyrinomonadaceae bacterium]
MKNTICTNWIRNTIAASLATAVFVTSSMVALASPNRPLMGELIVTGTTNGETPSATINGENATSGRSVSSTSTVTTPANSKAVINLGKNGRVELAPNTTLNLNFDEKTISGNLLSGNAKVLGASGVEVKINTKDGMFTNEANQASVFAVNLESGTAQAISENGAVFFNNGTTVTRVAQDTDNDGDLSLADVAVPLAILVGAVAASVIYIVTRDDQQLGVVSPTR